MRRAHGHMVFALVAVALAAVTVGESLRLQHAQSINAAVATWSRAAAPATAAHSQPPTWATAGAADHLPPEARLARAVALSKVDYDAALAAYKEIIPAVLRQLKDQEYYVRRELPPGAAPYNQPAPINDGRALPLTVATAA